jgi:hypothetical protein
MQVDHIGTPKKDIHGEREREREREDYRHSPILQKKARKWHEKAQRDRC